MKKKWMGLGLAVLMAVVVVGLHDAAAQASGLQAPADEIIIDGKKPAGFKHAPHIALGVACGQCHHDNEHQPRSAEAIGGMVDANELKCASCHNTEFANPELRERKDIFHARCKECHQTGYNDKKGPTQCGACHIKKRKAIEGC